MNSCSISSDDLNETRINDPPLLQHGKCFLALKRRGMAIPFGPQASEYPVHLCFSCSMPKADRSVLNEPLDLDSHCARLRHTASLTVTLIPAMHCK